MVPGMVVMKNSESGLKYCNVKVGMCVCAQTYDRLGIMYSLFIIVKNASGEHNLRKHLLGSHFRGLLHIYSVLLFLEVD